MTNHRVSARVTCAAILLTLLPGAVLGAPARAHAGPARHVIVVVIDGARWSETLGDSLATWCPRQQHDLAPLGSTVPDFRNEGLTITFPGTSAVLTGTWQVLLNDGTEPSHVPTVFESWRTATGAPETDAWIVTSKDKIAALRCSDHPAGGPAVQASASLNPDDPAALTAALGVLAQYHPALMELHLGWTDITAHDGDWVGYTTMLRQADSLVYVLWQAIQADTALAGSTALFVTNDHGRHDDAHGGFDSHGDGCPGCRHVELLALGAGIRAGFVASAWHRQIDIVPTIGALLGFATPWAWGAPMNDLLITPVGSTGPDRELRGLHLQPPYPNPSASTTRLGLVLPRAGRLRVNVFDAQGRRVATLYSGSAPAGPLALAWDGNDASGRPVPAGRYEVRASSGGDSATQSVLRVR